MKCKKGYVLENDWFFKGGIKKCKANNMFVELSFHASGILRKELGNIESEGVETEKTKLITDTTLRDKLIKFYGGDKILYDKDKTHDFYFYFQEFADQVRDNKIHGISCWVNAGNACQYFSVETENSTEIKSIDCLFKKFIHANRIFMALSYFY